MSEAKEGRKDTMLRKPNNIEDAPNGGCTLSYKCPSCGTTTVIKLTLDEALDLGAGLANRKPIQDILPGKTPTEREVMVSGLCPKCQDDFFKEEEEEEDEEA